MLTLYIYVQSEKILIYFSIQYIDETFYIGDIRHKGSVQLHCYLIILGPTWLILM